MGGERVLGLTPIAPWLFSVRCSLKKAWIATTRNIASFILPSLLLYSLIRVFASVKGQTAQGANEDNPLDGLVGPSLAGSTPLSPVPFHEADYSLACCFICPKQFYLFYFIVSIPNVNVPGYHRNGQLREDRARP